MLEKMRKVAVEKILWAIKAQRWYFLENNPKVLLDKNTLYIWANLKYFLYAKKMSWSMCTSYDREEVKNLINEINSQNWGGYNSWFIPTPDMLWNMIEDKTFPFQHGNKWCIQGINSWCVEYFDGTEITITDKDLIISGSDTGLSTSGYFCLLQVCSPPLHTPISNPFTRGCGQSMVK